MNDSPLQHSLEVLKKVGIHAPFGKAKLALYDIVVNRQSR
jgi:hypothetical protein